LTEREGAKATYWYRFDTYLIMLKFNRGRREANFLHVFVLTARQYGEVVLPDASTGQSTGTPRQRGQKAVTVQGGYGALFAIQVQSLLSITSVAVQVWSEPRIYPRLQIWLRALAQCRGTNYLVARNLSRCRILIAGRWACPGATTNTNLSWVQKQKQKVWQTTYPYCPCYRPLCVLCYSRVRRMKSSLDE